MKSKPFTFHVHLPEGIERIGKPVVLGNIKELGLWENPIIKLRQPFSENQTYWQSEPTIINFNETNDIIKYKFAIRVSKPLFEREEKNVFEGSGDKDKDNRIL